MVGEPTCDGTDAAPLNGDIGSSGISATIPAAALAALTEHWNSTPVRMSLFGNLFGDIVPSLSQGFRARHM
jgi:hypothetical protein